MATIDVIREILEENLGIDVSAVDESATFESLNIDSLDLVELACELEDRLDIELDDVDDLKNLGELVKHIDNL